MGRELKVSDGYITIGRMPIMLRSSHCRLSRKDVRARKQECPYDPGR